MSFEDPADSDGTRDADRQTGRQQQKAFAQDELEHGTRAATKGEADADFLGALGHEIRQHACYSPTAESSSATAPNASDSTIDERLVTSDRSVRSVMVRKSYTGISRLRRPISLRTAPATDVGTPQVWNTCMVFFQMVLLLGYGYTHFVSTRLKPRAQVILHLLVMLSPFVVFFVFPFWEYEPLHIRNYIKEWIPNFGGNPIFATLLLLAMVIGLPFFVVSTTAPLLQKWFGFTGHEAAKDPYFLYGASNLGSMLSLLVYPALIEPFSVPQHASRLLWMAGFAVLAALVVVAVVDGLEADRRSRAQKIEAERPEISTQPVSGEVLAGAIQAKPSSPNRMDPTESAPIRSIETVDLWRRLRWVALAAVPSSMMLGITSHITTDLSPIPLFWLIPLAFYCCRSFSCSPAGHLCGSKSRTRSCCCCSRSPSLL